MAEEAVEVAETHSFECPGCGATLVYCADAEKLSCEYCDGEHEVPDSPAAGTVSEKELAELFMAETEHGLPDKKVLECEQCGASTTVSGQKTTGRCTFCASQMVVERDAKDVLSPTALIPFKVEKEEAASSFRKWMGTLWFRPGDLKKMAKVAEIEGVYTPYWTFDARAESRWRAQSGTYYYEQESYTDSEGKTRQRQVRKTRWNPARGNRHHFYDDLLICGSKGLDSSLVSRLEPYHTKSELVAYQPEYLAGWSAEEYGLEPGEAWSEARKQLEEREYKASGKEVPGDTHRELQVSTQLNEITWKHVLLPVWIAAYRYGDKSYRFLVNGETGEVSGEAPYSWWKIFFFIMFLGFVLLTIFGTGGLAIIPWAGMAVVGAMIYGISRLLSSA